MNFIDEEDLISKIANILNLEEIADTDDIDKFHNLIYILCKTAIESQISLITREADFILKR